jgi:hypothetical protein
VIEWNKEKAERLLSERNIDKVIDKPFDEEDAYLMKQIEAGNVTNISKKRETEIRETVL